VTEPLAQGGGEYVALLDLRGTPATSATVRVEAIDQAGNVAQQTISLQFDFAVPGGTGGGP